MDDNFLSNIMTLLFHLLFEPSCFDAQIEMKDIVLFKLVYY